MEPAQFFAASRVAIVAGKGGVGKTTVSATLAAAAARSGLATLIVEVEGKSGLPVLFDRDELGYEEIPLLVPSDTTAGVRARTLTPDEALLEYLRDNGLGRLSKRLVHSGAVDMVSTAIPGVKDLMVLGKVKQIEVNMGQGARSAPDLVVIDAPAAGHAITFLQSPRGLADAVKVGPIAKQATDVLGLLTEPGRSQVLLVALPEETPVNELVDTAFALEDKVGISLGPVVVNGVYEPVDGLSADPVAAAEAVGRSLRPGEADALAAAADFRRHRMALQSEQLARLADKLPLPQIHLPFLFDADLGLAQLDVLVDRFLAGVAALPDAVPDGVGP